MHKKITIGKAARGRVVEVTIDFDGKRLSITGEVGHPRANDCDACGQIDLDNYPLVESRYPRSTRRKLKEVWAKWHLNDMRPGCFHQREAKWDERPIDPSKPLNVYGKHFEGQQHASWNMLTWVSRDEHPEGLLNAPCEECGYKFGSAWLFEPVPQDVITFLESL